MDSQNLERFIEFLFVGVALGLVEDLIAIQLATGEKITLQMVWIVILVAIPFAAFSELVVDSDDYRIMEKIADLLH